MEESGNPELQEIPYLRFIIQLKAVIHARTFASVIMHAVERITQIQIRAIFQSGIVNIVVVRHHIHAIEHLIENTYVPFSDFLIEFHSIWNTNTPSYSLSLCIA